MYAKKLRLSDLKLSYEELINLFKISSAVNDVALHDLRGRLWGITACLDLAQLEIQNPLKTASNKRKLDRALSQAMIECSALSTSLNKFLSRYKVEDFDQQFISRPAELVRVLRDSLKYPGIEIGPRAPKSLEILFPENILFGIFSELVRNAAHPPTEERRILVDWKTDGLHFHCEVHDNGPGFFEKPIEKFQPLDAIWDRLPKVGQGLRILNRIMRICKGYLLFSTSPRLGGALVYFQFPVSRLYRR